MSRRRKPGQWVASPRPRWVTAAAGRWDPRVSEPSAAGIIRAATATALPPDEPPGARDRSHGFFTAMKALFSEDEPMANSSMLHLPGRMAPAALSRVTTVAS